MQNKYSSLLWRVLRVAIPLLLTLLWLGFLFGNSLKDATESSIQSGEVQEIINEIAFSLGVEKPIPESTVRDLAHFTEFAILSTLICLDFWGLGISPFFARQRFDFLWLLLSLPICFLLANFDEYLQTFSEGRAQNFSDVLIDTAGALLGVTIFMGVFLLLRAVFGKQKNT